MFVQDLTGHQPSYYNVAIAVDLNFEQQCCYNQYSIVFSTDTTSFMCQRNFLFLYVIQLDKLLSPC